MGPPTSAARRPGRGVPLLLRAALFTIGAVPASMVVGPIGAAGTVPMLLALLLGAFWAVSWAWGLHDPVPARHPGRVAVAALLLASAASAAALYVGATGGSTDVTRAAGERWLLLVVASAALITVCAECARTTADVAQCVRALLNGFAVCCLVALVQFTSHVDPVTWAHYVMPGFTENGGSTPFQPRGALVRVAGTTFSPIELGVVASMLLPLSLWRAVFDDAGRRWLSWTQTGVLVLAVAVSISRSGILGIAVALAVVLPFLPRTTRRWVLVTAPVAVAGLFLAVPGLVSTLGGALGADASDPSISTRLDNYPRVVAMYDAHPLLGLGPGNYMPTDALHILDNQYLNSLVTTGAVGVVATIVYLVLPGVAGLHAARTARSASLRCLAGALAAGTLAGAVCSSTFDSLSFPVFALTFPALVGLSGAAWLLVRHERHEEERWTPPTS
ncbi:O-antigen ligase family protein [Cellulomonas sp. Marseille-Q8402]